MEKDFKRLIKEEQENFEIMENEKHFDGSSFAEELLFVLGDYFVGNFALDGSAIVCSFANKQQFRLEIREV